MLTDFPYVSITAEMRNLVGKCDKGTRVYRREGSYKEAGEWFTDLDEAFNDQFVSPGGVAMFVPVSRAAVHKRMQEGRLTTFCFHVVHAEKTFFGNVRKAKANPFVCIPVSECKAWARELEGKRGGSAPVGESHIGDDFLARDPEDAGKRGVRYTEEYVERDTEEWIKAETRENAKRKVTRGKSTTSEED